MFQVVSRGFQGYLKEIYKVCQGSFNGVSGSFKSVKRKFQGHFKIVSRVFQERLKGISGEILLGFKVI